MRQRISAGLAWLAQKVQGKTMEEIPWEKQSDGSEMRIVDGEVQSRKSEDSTHDIGGLQVPISEFLPSQEEMAAMVQQMPDDAFEKSHDVFVAEKERRSKLPPPEHDHVWGSGILPGARRVRICKLCGLTEDVSS